MHKFFSDFEYFWNLIEKGDNFSFARYADGEVMLMEGREVSEHTQAYNIDKWKSPPILTKVGKELLGTLGHTEPNYYYAISGINDNINDYNFLRKRINHNEKNITFVNLWINANYQKTKSKMSSLNREVILICNENANPKNFPFKVKEIVPFPNNCISYWEENSSKFINGLLDKTKNLSNQLFFISCGPVSEIIIHELYNSNPNNSYVDVGSSIDEYVHNKITRPYMSNISIYSKFISNF
jgi:hypothetical protein